MMSGHALVIGNCFVADEASLTEVGDGYDHAARALAVRCSGLIVRGITGLEVRHRLDSDWRAWQEAEQPGQLRLHLVDVIAEILHDLAGRYRAIFRVVPDSRAEYSEVVETLVARDGEHLALDTLDLAQADLMNLLGSQIAQRRAALNVVAITLLTTWQRGDRQSGSPKGCIILGDEIGEREVRWQYLVDHGCRDLPGQAALLVRGNACREFLSRQQKRVRGNDAQTLTWHLFQQKTHRHELIVPAGAQN